MSTATLLPLSTPFDWLAFSTATLPQWRQTLEFNGGIFGRLIAQNYFDAATNVLPLMPAMLEPFDRDVHGTNEGNRSNRKLAESNYTLNTGYATTVITTERNFRAGIIAAIEDYQLSAAMALTPTGANFATPALAIHSVPAQDIIPAILALARLNSRQQIQGLITDLQKPFLCSATDSIDKFVFQFRRLVKILEANQETIGPVQLLDFFRNATNANYRDILLPFYAIAASAPGSDLAAHIAAFLNARDAFDSWLELQSHAPTALSAVAKPTPTAPSTKRPFYCWTHGHGYHSSADCNLKESNKGHQATATKAATMGGNSRIAEFRPAWKAK